MLLSTEIMTASDDNFGTEVVSELRPKRVASDMFMEISLRDNSAHSYVELSFTRGEKIYCEFNFNVSDHKN